MRNRIKFLILKAVCLAFALSLFQSEIMAAESRFSNIIMIDGHTHDLVPRNGKDPVQAGMERMKNTGIGGLILPFPLNRANPENVIQQITNDINFLKSYTADNGFRIKVANRFFGRDRQDESYTLQVLLSVEYFNGLFDANLDNILKLKDLGISSITLIDNEYNRLSENKNGKTELNSFGGKVVQKLNDAGIVMDISHLPEPVQLCVIAASKKPVFASHSNMRGIADVPRNISDKVMRELINKGGIVLLTLNKEYLYGNAPAGTASGIAKLIEHIDYAASNFGVDYVGIGSDYGGSGMNTTDDLFGVECFQNIAEQLMKKGYSIEQVKKIMGGNLITFFSTSENSPFNAKN